MSPGPATHAPSPTHPAHTQHPTDSAELVRRCRLGDDDASRTLVQHLYPLVIRIVRAHRPRRVDEEDLAQMVFCRLFDRLHQWRATAPFEHWVSRVAVNVCLHQLAHHRVRPETRWSDLPREQAENLDRTLADNSDTSQPAHALAARDLVEQLLAAASPRDRLVLQLLDLEDRSVEEVSRITGWSRTLVKVQAFRARRRMRRFLARLLPEESR